MSIVLCAVKLAERLSAVPYTVMVLYSYQVMAYIAMAYLVMAYLVMARQTRRAPFCRAI